MYTCISLRKTERERERERKLASYSTKRRYRSYYIGNDSHNRAKLLL